MGSSIIWGNLLAMCIVMVALVIGLWQWLAYYTQHGVEVNVPCVEGKMFADARYTLESNNLQAVVVDSTYDRAMPAGIILKQHPKAGSNVKEGREVYLTINSKETPTRTVPDIADNSSLREAQEILRQLGFRLGPVEYVNGDKDWVIGVKCQGRSVYAGDKVPIDASIVLQVGSGLGEGEDSIYSDNDDWD